MKNLLVIILISGLACCSSSSNITKSWVSPAASGKVYNKILVLGLIAEPDTTIRVKLEKHIADDLRNLGYTALCSCEEYDSKAFRGLTEQQAIDKLNNAGIDAVLTVVLLDKKKEQYYMKPNDRMAMNDPNTFTYTTDHFWGYYEVTRDRINAPGYYTTETKYFWQSNFYDLKSKGLMFSANSETFYPGTTSQMGHEYGLMIVKSLVSKHVISKNK